MKLKKDDQERMIHDFCVLNSIDPKEVLDKESDKETKITKLKSQFILERK